MIEQLIFSQLLTNEEFARKVMPHLKDDYFSNSEEKNFLKIYRHFFSKYNKIPSKQAMLLEIEKLKSSAEVYKTLVSFVNTKEEFTETVEYLVSQTEEFCKEKALFNALKESVLIIDGASKSDKGKASIPTILSEALSVCFDSSVGHNYIEDAMARYEYYHMTEARVKTGIARIDKITKGGFPKKTLNVILSPPHGGKTFGMVNIGAGALKQGANVLYITNEMAAEEIGRRFDVNLMGIDFDTLAAIPRNVFQSKFGKMVEGARGKLVIKEYATGTATAAHYRALLAELKTKQNFVPDLIIVDYMNICASEFYKNGSAHNSYTIVGSIGKELRALAIESNAALLTATQTNRSGVDNSDVDMTSVSDSAATSMIADFIIAAISTGELKQLNQILWKQIKNRYAGISDDEKFLMGVNMKTQTMYDLDASTPQDIPEKKTKPINKGKSVPSEQVSIDLNHKIPPTASFEGFNFNEDD